MGGMASSQAGPCCCRTHAASLRVPNLGVQGSGLCLMFGR